MLQRAAALKVIGMEYEERPMRGINAARLQPVQIIAPGSSKNGLSKNGRYAGFVIRAEAPHGARAVLAPKGTLDVHCPG